MLAELAEKMKTLKGVIGSVEKQFGKDSADAADAKMTDLSYQMFPDGRDYDFGKVKRGAPVKHTFRFVNTSNVTLEVISVGKCG